MHDKQSDNAVRVTCAVAGEAELCWNIDQALHSGLPDATERGFFLQGSTLEDYREFQKSAIFYVARYGDELSGFVIALPSGHPRFVSLLEKRQAFSLSSEDILAIPNLIWIAKVAVLRKKARCGIGTALYAHLFAAYPASAMITATLIEPVYNLASARFHEKMGFAKVGTIDSGDRGELKKCKSAVIFLEFNSPVSPRHRS